MPAERLWRLQAGNPAGLSAKCACVLCRRPLAAAPKSLSQAWEPNLSGGRGGV